jgi:hypothetical protein
VPRVNGSVCELVTDRSADGAAIIDDVVAAAP